MNPARYISAKKSMQPIANHPKPVFFHQNKKAQPKQTVLSGHMPQKLYQPILYNLTKPNE